MKPIHRAILESNEQAVEVLICQGTDLNCLDNKDRTPIQVAVEMENLTILKLLLIGGASRRGRCLNSIIRKGKLDIVKTILEYSSEMSPPLMNELLCSAIIYNHLDIVQILLDSNANPNYIQDLTCSTFPYKNEFLCRTPLQLACQNGREDIVKTLVDHGADINMRVSDQTILYLAIANAHLSTVRFLLRSGVDVKIQNPIGRTALHAAVCMGNAELSDIGISNINKSEETKNKLEIIRLLIDHGCEVDIQDVDGYCPLYLAIKNQCGQFHFNTEKCWEYIFKLLLNAGGSIDVQDKYGRTPLHFVAPLRHPKVTGLLLTYSADPNIQDDWGDTPLHKACQYQCEENILMLLNKGGNPNILNKTRRTPLIEAIDGCCESIISTILKSGGNTMIQDKKGDTTLHYAVMNSSNKKETQIILSTLLRYGGDPNSQNENGDTPLHKACEGSDRDLIITILKYGGNPNIQNKNGYTPFHNAVESFKNVYSDGVLTAILKQGGDPNVKNKQGNTPLHKACVYETEECIRFILESGGDPNIQDKDGKTPLHHAIESNNCCEVLMPLLDSGGKPNICDKLGNTSLHSACRMNCEVCVRVILYSGGCPNTKNLEGDTPMHNLDELDPDGVLSALLDFGADLNIENKTGRIPLHNQRNSNIFTRYFALRQCANLYVNPGVLRTTHLQADIKSFLKIYEEELQAIKSETVFNTKVTYYFILKGTSQILINLFRNRDIIDALETEDYLVKFPCYGSMINWNYRKALMRKELIDQVLIMYSAIFLNLPYNCIEHILSFLNNDDLRKLLVSLKFCRLNINSA